MKQAITDKTLVVAIMLANNDIEQTEYMRDFQQAQNNHFRLGVYVTAIAVLLVLGLALWQFTPENLIKKLNLQQMGTESQTHLVLKDSSDATLSGPENNQSLNSIEEVKTIKTDLRNLPGLVENESLMSVKKPKNAELALFINEYGLEDESGVLLEAFEQENLLVIHSILAEQGWQLLLSDKPFIEPPRKVIKRLFNNQQDYWLMLWKPKIQFDKYHFGLKSSQVVVLQKLLKQEGFFNDIEDGVVGSKTMYSVASYQRSIGIEPTGKADPLTLYFLTRDNNALTM